MNTAKSRSTDPNIVRGKADEFSAAQTDRPGKPNAGTERRKEETSPAPSDLLAEYVRKDELAQQFGVSERTIERWVRLRLLPAPVRLGRTSLFHLPTIQQHLAGQLQPERRRQRRP